MEAKLTWCLFLCALNDTIDKTTTQNIHLKTTVFRLLEGWKVPKNIVKQGAG